MYSSQLYRLVLSALFFTSLSVSPVFLNAHTGLAHIFRNIDKSDNSNKEFHRNLRLGLALEKKFWMNVQNKNTRKFSKMLASIYQTMTPNGIRNKRQQIRQLEAANLLGFGFNHPRATRKGDTLVFSYDFIAIGNGIVSGPQISVWKKMCSGWKMISRAEEPFEAPISPI